MIELSKKNGRNDSEFKNIAILKILFIILVSLPFLFIIYRSIWVDNIKNNIVIYSALSAEAYFFSKFIINRPIRLLALYNLIIANLALFLFLTLPTILSLVINIEDKSALVINIKTFLLAMLIHIISCTLNIIFNKIHIK